MAKRMFAAEVICENRFLFLSKEAQLLYVHLCMHADDDGFCGCGRAVIPLIGASVSDFLALERAGFIYLFESGVVYIRDFRLMNRIPDEKRVPTKYLRERREIEEGRLPPRGNLW